MSQKIKVHINHYLALASLLGAGFSLLAYFRFNREAQAFIILITAAAYVGWGTLHHKLTHILTIQIIVEYILVATLGALLLLGMIGF